MVTLTDACFFCGAGEDSAEHVYGECAVVREARLRWAAVLGCELGDGWEVSDASSLYTGCEPCGGARDCVLQLGCLVGEERLPPFPFVSPGSQ